MAATLLDKPGSRHRCPGNPDHKTSIPDSRPVPVRHWFEPAFLYQATTVAFPAGIDTGTGGRHQTKLPGWDMPHGTVTGQQCVDHVGGDPANAGQQENDIAIDRPLCDRP